MKQTKVLALLLAALLLVSCLTACVAKPQSSEPAPQPTASQPETETPPETQPAAEPEAEPETDAQPQTISFTDDVGRVVEIPAQTTKVAPSGAVATMFLAAIAPEYMMTVHSSPSKGQLAYLDARLAELPETGQMYGSKASLNLEALLASGAELIIDLGDKKGDMAADLDALQEQVGIPVIFLEADLLHMADAFRTLGSILSGKAARGEELAAFVDETLAMAAENRAKITDEMRVSVLYTSGDDGLAANAKGSTQSQVLELIGAENAVVVDDVSNKGGGNLINLEQLYNFDPDVVVFCKDSIYETVAQDAAWTTLRAIGAGAYYEIPGEPYNWLSNPPSLNMLLGVWWLGNLLYPEVYDYDMAEKTQQLYALLWGYPLSADEAQQLLANSSGKR